MAVFEAVGVPGMIDELMRVAPAQSRIVVVGVCMQPDALTPMFGIAKELNVQFVLGYTPEEFAAGHLDGAINIPIDDLDARKGELKKDADIVLYCRSGGRSERGRALLAAAGYTKVHNLGAMSNWK
jgi:rhodanese-related sulfurtransferase